jgi:hypothetical protein
LLVTFLIAAAPASPALAAKLAKGNSVVWVGLNGNKSHILTSPASLASTGEENELGMHLAYSRFLCDEWAGVVSGGFDFGGAKFEPTSGTETKYTSSSYNVRLGMDRYAFINDDVALYAGPGLLYWRGKADYSLGAAKTQWPEVTELAFNGRLGMYARLGSRLGLFGHIGQVIGTNSGKDANGKATWWSNHHEGSVGLAVDF